MRAPIAPALAIAVIFALAACATSPISLSQASHGRRFAFAEQGPGTVMVTVIRDSGIQAAACAADVFVDGRLAGSVSAGEAIQLHIPAGEVIIGAQTASLCVGGLVERDTRLVAGRSQTFRIGFDHNGSLGLYRTTQR